MKTKWTILLLSMSAAVMIWSPRAARADGISFGIEIRHARDFHEPLGRHGYWVDIRGHGQCWYPAYVDHGWRPYTDGYWEWTDNGWYWVSEEPWAWATYHYGRWVWDEYYGWVWVPGTEWAPAWVVWRSGGGYIGWAPLPPGCDFDPFDNVMYFERFVIAPHAYVFVEHRHFCHRIRPSTVIVNQTIINQTINITRVQRVNNVVVNHGPSVRIVEKEAGRKLNPVPAIDLRRTDSRRAVESVQPAPLPRRDRNDKPEKPRMPVVIRGTDREETRLPARRTEESAPRVQPPRDSDATPPVVRPTPEVRQPYTPMPKRPALVPMEKPGVSQRSARSEERGTRESAPPATVKPAPPVTPPPSGSPVVSPGEDRKNGKERKYYDEGTLTGGGKRQRD